VFHRVSNDVVEERRETTRRHSSLGCAIHLANFSGNARRAVAAFGRNDARLRGAILLSSLSARAIANEPSLPSPPLSPSPSSCRHTRASRSPGIPESKSLDRSSPRERERRRVFRPRSGALCSEVRAPLSRRIQRINGRARSGEERRKKICRESRGAIIIHGRERTPRGGEREGAPGRSDH